jgi:hypothetical protein
MIGLLLTVAAIAAAAGALALAGWTLARRWRLQQQLLHSRQTNWRDHATGLFARTALLPTLGAEVRRAARMDWTLTLLAIEVDAQPDEFGCKLSGGLRFPEIGFRAGENTFVIVVPNADAACIADLEARCAAATAEPYGGTLADVQFPRDGSTESELLQRAQELLAA